MRTEPIKPQPTFGGYNSVLKTLYKKGKLPQVKKVFMATGSLKIIVVLNIYFAGSKEAQPTYQTLF